MIVSFLLSILVYNYVHFLHALLSSLCDKLFGGLINVNHYYSNVLTFSILNHHKYLDMHFDSQLKWDIHVANTCKKMSYYSYLINYHRQQLPSHIFKMLANTLVFFHLYALPI